MSKIFELWEQLQLNTALYINSDIRLPPGMQVLHHNKSV